MLQGEASRTIREVIVIPQLSGCTKANRSGEGRAVTRHLPGIPRVLIFHNRVKLKPVEKIFGRCMHEEDLSNNAHNKFLCIRTHISRWVKVAHLFACPAEISEKMVLFTIS